MKVFIGTVKDTNKAKTATVIVERIVVHPLYKKRIRKQKKYLVHDETGVQTGQLVRFKASRPYSKLVKWIILGVVSRKENVKATVKEPKKSVEKKEIKPKKQVKTVKKAVKKTETKK